MGGALGAQISAVNVTAAPGVGESTAPKSVTASGEFGSDSAATGAVNTIGGPLVQFIDATDDKMVNDEASGSARMPPGIVDGSLLDALKRPVLAFTYTWTSSAHAFNFDPYNSWYSSVFMSRKYANHWIVRTGGLRLRCVTNGLPYNYGRLAVGYWPLMLEDQYATTFAQSSVTKLSTLPLFTTIDPTVDTTFEWDLPDLMPYDQTSALSANAYGSVIATQCCALATTQTTGSPSVSISFYVSAKSPTLHFLTATAPGVGTSGTGELPSAILKRIGSDFGALSKVPIVGSFATAAGMAATLGSRLASVFGYSRSLIDAAPTPMYQYTQGDMATVDSRDNCRPLTLLTHSTTSIDTTYLGTNNIDQMSVDYIKRKWSYANGDLTWNSTDAVGAYNNNVKVGPHYGMSGAVGTPYAPTHISWLCSMAAYYRGSIELKLVFCCSVFHTGRLELIFDPDLAASTPSVDVTPVTNSIIVDLAQQREVVMVIPYCGTNPLGITNNNAGYAYGMTALAGVSAMGFLRTRVVSPLLAGNSSGPITINVYIRAGTDFEIFQPRLMTTDGVEHVNFFPTNTPGSYPHSTYLFFGTSSGPTDEGSQMVDGVMAATEPIKSLRQLLQRFTYAGNTTITPSAGNTSYVTIRDMPAPPGYVNDLVGTPYYNTVPWNFFNYIQGAYAGYRGSIRHKLLAEWPDNINRAVFKDPFSYCNLMDLTKGQTSGIGNAKNLFYPFGAAAGMALYCPTPGGQRDITIQSQWVDANQRYILRGYTALAVNTGPGIVMLTELPAGQTEVDSYVDNYIAAGDDFTFVQYMGPPVIYLITGSN